MRGVVKSATKLLLSDVSEVVVVVTDLKKWVS